MPLQNLRTLLDSWQPGAFNAALAALLWVALWLVRKFRPLFFAKLPPALQAWPALVLGAVMAALSASTAGNLGQSVLNALGMALTGLLSGVLASGIHRTLKESKLPYGENDVPPKKPNVPLAAGILFLILFTFGCGVPAKTVVADACTVIDSGNPQIGVLCLTAEEIISLFGHVKASRSYRASHPGDAPDRTIDVCQGTTQ